MRPIEAGTFADRASFCEAIRQGILALRFRVGKLTVIRRSRTATQLTSADSAGHTSTDKQQSVVTSPSENGPGRGKCNTTERDRSSMKAVVKIAAKACE
jgi:hypothetical protein